MKINFKPMGAYQTNCYIVTIEGKDIIIDPGVGAAEWVKKNVQNPVAILNTHGHFDHVWSNAAVKKAFNIPIYVPKADAFMLKNDPFGQNTPPSEADILVEGDQEFDIEGIKIKYILFAGHTPGCSVIEIENAMFSGDFVFAGSIGRVDFPYSSPEQMKKSIKKFLKIPYDKKIYTGHGEPTTIKREQGSIGMWLNYI